MNPTNRYCFSLFCMLCWLGSMPLLAQNLQTQTSPAFELEHWKKAEPDPSVLPLHNGHLLAAYASWDPFNPLDTIMPADSNVYSYDNDFRLTEIIGFSYDTGLFSHNFRLLYAYPNDSVKTTFQDWEPTAGTWENLSQSVAKLNAAGSTVYLLSSGWNDTINQWTPSSQTFTFRNADDRDTAVLSQIWKPGSASWEDNTRSRTHWSAFFPQFTPGYNWRISERYLVDSMRWDTSRTEHNSFDGNGNILTNQIFNYGFNQWGNLNTWTYNAQDQPGSRLAQRFDFNSQQWNNELKVSLSYQGANLFDWDSITEEIWVESPGFTGWSNSRKTKYVNTPNGQEITQETGVNNTEWELSARIVQSENAQQQLESVLTQSWTGSDWENSQKTTYSYDPNEETSEVKDFDWAFTTSDWEMRFRSAFYYTFATDINPPQNLGFSAYPNPMQNHLRVDIQTDKPAKFTLRLMDAKGQLIASYRPEIQAGSTNSFQLPMEELPAGLYFLILQSPARQQSLKLLKR